MKIALFIVLLCMALQIAAQEAKKTTVHITKVENINGVSKFTDTTYTTDDPKVLLNEENYGKDGKNVTVVVTENVTGTDNNGVKKGSICKTVVYSDTLDGEGVHTITNINGDLSAEMLKALEEAHSGMRVESMGDGSHSTAMVLSDGIVLSSTSTGGSKTMRKLFIVKAVKITDATDAETKKLRKEAGPTNGKLSLQNIKFSPNPASGKFNLSFNTSEKGDAEITILNSEGKKVYSESLPNFNGHYSKEVDISENPKGIYFVRIQQGDHSQMKKLIID